MKKIIIPLIALLIIGIGAYVYTQKPEILLSREQTELPSEESENGQKQKEEPENRNGDENQTPIEDMEPKVFENIYIDQEQEFSIEYSEEITAEERADGYTSFYLFGPTQEENTEFYDGISIRIRQEELEENMTLEEKAEELVNQVSPVGEITQEVQETTLNGYEGYTYSSLTVGSETTSYLLKYPGSETKYLHVVNATADPEDQGYEETAETMLSTLELL